MADEDPDPHQGEDHGNGHSPYGVLAGIAAILSMGALRSCDDVARIASHTADVNVGRYTDDIGLGSTGVRAMDEGQIGRIADKVSHSQPPGSVADNGTLAKYAASDLADLEKYTSDIGQQAAALEDASGIADGFSRIMFETRNFEPRMQLVYAAPKNGREFKSIFDRTATASELAVVARATKRISGISQSRPMERAVDVLGVIDNEQGSVVVIVGHNDSGKLRLADGSEVDIAVMAQRCEASGKLCVVLSCNSNQFLASARSTRGVDDPLTYEEAGRIGTEIASVFDKLAAQHGDMLGPTNLLRANQVDALVKLSLEKGIARNRSTKRLRQSGKLVSFGTGGGLIVYERGVGEPTS